MRVLTARRPRLGNILSYYSSVLFRHNRGHLTTSAAIEPPPAHAHDVTMGSRYNTANSHLFTTTNAMPPLSIADA